MRTLLYVPIIHTEDDMGSLADFVKDEYKRKYSRIKWQEQVNAIKNIWDKIYEKVLSLDLKWQKVRIYQDGLPVNEVGTPETSSGFNRAYKIVETLSQQGNLNHKLIMELAKKGATIEGTEDTELLKAEYANMLKIAQAKTLPERDRLIEQYNPVAHDLLLKRDQFIANRINKTLKNGETGILFLGMMHQVNRLIPKDIIIEYPCSAYARFILGK